MCPILRLSERDVAFPRKDYTLMKMLNHAENNQIPKINARVFPWSDGVQILKILEKEIGFSQISL